MTHPVAPTRYPKLKIALAIVGAIVAAPVLFAIFIASLSKGGR